MGEATHISWAHATFNPWWGCEKVSPACTNCYAERDAARYGHRVWGKAAPRRFLSEKYWMQPHRWDIEAKAARVRRRVFCASMADVFESREELDPWREKLWDLIDTTRGLDWLLLTKRPENILGMIPRSWRSAAPVNVWYGTTVENQEWAEKRIPELLKVPARIRFLSCEPLVGPIDLKRLKTGFCSTCKQTVYSDLLAGTVTCGCCAEGPEPTCSQVDWVITGGESGPGARPADPAWYRQLRDQAVAAGVPFHFKQWGEWAPWAPQLAPAHGTGDIRIRLGKKAAGRLLDGRTWDEAPNTEKEIGA